MFAATCLALVAPLVSTVAQAQPFSYEVVQTDLPGVQYSRLALGDIDGDGDLDVALSGASRAEAPFLPRVTVGTNLREFFGEDTWVRSFSSAQVGTGKWHGAVSFLDLDGDGKLDLLSSGTSAEDFPFASNMALYPGDGSGGFGDASQSLDGLHNGAMTVADFDGDGDADIMAIGADASETHQTILFVNAGGSLSATDPGLPGIAYGDIEAGDIDNDGDADLVIAGVTTDGAFVSNIFANAGDGTFTVFGPPLPRLAHPEIELGDYDADGDLDIAIAGGIASPYLFHSSIHILRNDGSSFVETGVLEGGFFGQIAWGDHDNDGDLDLLAVGRIGFVEPRIARIYENVDGAFRQQVVFPGLANSSGDFADYDGDGDLDVVLTGIDLTDLSPFRFYRNDGLILNTPPSVPTGLASASDNGVISLTWQPSTDGQTPSAGLTYNIRIGTTAGASDIRSALAIASSGNRLVSARGNADQSRRVTLRLPPGTYYWSVQAIDNSYAPSPFAEERSFSVTSQSIETGTETQEAAATALTDPYPNPAADAVRIPFAVAPGESGRIAVYTATGRLVSSKSVVPTTAAGSEWIWRGVDDSGSRVASGIYFVRLETESYSRTKTVVIIR